MLSTSMKWRPDKTFSGALISCPKRKGLSDDANDRVNRDRLGRMFYGGDVAGEVNREAPAQAECLDREHRLHPFGYIVYTLAWI
jgi:hypothetical protein